jgi:archaellum component FlaF (FlaF/FlaG flagellin family)
MENYRHSWYWLTLITLHFMSQSWAEPLPRGVGCTPWLCPTELGTLYAGVNPELATGFTLVPAEIRRERSRIWSGQTLSNPLAEFTNGDYAELPPGSYVTTDANGEAWLRLSTCPATLVYLYWESGLATSSCSKAGRGNSVCVFGGTAAFRNQCSNMILETPSAEIELLGTWVAISYLPERQLSLVQVLEGQAVVRPVNDFDTISYGEPTLVDEGFFWFSAPDFVSGPLQGLREREAHPLEQLTLLYGVFGLERWTFAIKSRAEADGAIPDTTGPVITFFNAPRSTLEPGNSATITVEAEDAASGMNLIDILLDGNVVMRCESERCETSFGLPNEGDYFVEAIAYDRAGNATSESVVLSVEQILPVIIRQFDVRTVKNADDDDTDEDSANNNGRVSVMVVAENAVRIEIYFNGSQVQRCDSQSCSAEIASLIVGDYPVQVFAYGEDGSQLPLTTSVSVGRDPVIR